MKTEVQILSQVHAFNLTSKVGSRVKVEMPKIEDIKNALQLRLNLIQSEPNGIVRETMIQNLLLDI